MRSVTFWGKFTSGSRISASRSDLLKLPKIVPGAVHFVEKCQFFCTFYKIDLKSIATKPKPIVTHLICTRFAAS